MGSDEKVVTIVSSSSPFPCPSPVRKVITPKSIHVITARVVCLVFSVVAISLMVTAQQSSTLSIFGFQLPVYSKWSLSDSFEYLVGVTGVIAAHSLIQLVICVSRLRRKCLVVPSSTYAWILYAMDQVLAYAAMSAASASSGVTSLNRTGIKHSSLPNFCKPLEAFCNRVAASIAFTFLACFFLAASTVLDIISLKSFSSMDNGSPQLKS